MKGISCVAMVLAAIGAVNWGLIWAFDFNLVYTLVGSIPMLEKIVYILVWLSWVIVLLNMSVMKSK